MVKRFRAIVATLIKEPKDPFTRSNTMIGNSFVINKKKFPYLIKYGWIKVKQSDGTILLFNEDEIVIEMEGKK
jgi:hypothetical protein